MKEAVSREVRDRPPAVELASVGLGVMRPSGAYVIALMQLEPVERRVKILVDAAKKLGISLEELAEAYTDGPCENCGTSLAAHKADGGKCP
jgi:hypothetical protein